MKILRIFLGVVYVLLILLALLLAKTCGHEPEPEEEPDDEDTTAVEPEPADTSDIERAEDVGAHGKLKITLLWDFPGDIDIHVLEPNGNEIYYENKRDAATGGALDHDDQRGGSGAAENVTWDTPPSGNYRVALVYYKPYPETAAPTPGTCRVIVFNGDADPETYEVQMNGVLQQAVNVTTVQVE